MLNAPRLVTLLEVPLNGPEPPLVAVLVRLPVIFGRPADTVVPGFVLPLSTPIKTLFYRFGGFLFCIYV
nr:MAG TPA: hypothetical protein [Caudoviricetes sp.]